MILFLVFIGLILLVLAVIAIASIKILRGIDMLRSSLEDFDNTLFGAFVDLKARMLAIEQLRDYSSNSEESNINSSSSRS